MIARTHVRCPGCSKVIALRLSIGGPDTQPFYYVCVACGVATRGAIDASAPPKVALNLEDGEQLYLDKEPPDTQVVTVDSSIPLLGSAKELWDVGGSPFIYLHTILGNRLDLYVKGSGKFRGLIEADGKRIDRLITYYLDRNWSAFDAAVPEVWPDQNLPTLVWHRHDTMHRLLDLLTAPVWTADVYPRMKEAWNKVQNPACAHSAALLVATRTAVATSELIDLQNELFDCFRLWIRNHDAWMPGFTMNLMPEPRAQYGDLRVYRDDFPALRDLYIRVFEACHSALPFLMGRLNVSTRGSIDAFVHPPELSAKRQPKTVAAFHKLTSWERALYLRGLPVWETAWTETLDRGLRNKIGHAKVRHHLQSGELRVQGEDSVPYSAFLAKTHLLIFPLLAVMNAVKLTLIHGAMLDDQDAARNKQL